MNFYLWLLGPDYQMPLAGNRPWHHIVRVVEVKRNDDTEAKAEEQMEAYIQAENLRRKSPGISGYGQHGVHILVAGEHASQDASWAGIAMPAPGDQFTRELCEISILSKLTGVFCRLSLVCS